MMVLHTIIGEYDVLYAQERELAYAAEQVQAVLSTNPADFLKETAAEPKIEKRNKL